MASAQPRGADTVPSFPGHLVFDGLPAVTFLRQASSVVGPARAGAARRVLGTVTRPFPSCASVSSCAEQGAEAVGRPVRLWGRHGG